MRRHHRCTDECTCHPPATLRDPVTETACRYGYCTEWRCPACNGYLGGCGPVGCGCDGYPVRWMLHPAMQPRLEAAAVKPSIARRGRRRTRPTGKR
jgi:hypothetical protein